MWQWRGQGWGRPPSVVSTRLCSKTNEFCSCYMHSSGFFMRINAFAAGDPAWGGSFQCSLDCWAKASLPFPITSPHSPLSNYLTPLSTFGLNVHSWFIPKPNSWLCRWHVMVVLLAWWWQPSSLSAKLSELASRRADWLSSMTIGHQQQQRKSCRSLETVIWACDAERDAVSVDQYCSPLHRSASSSCLSSPVAAESVSASVCDKLCTDDKICHR